MICTLFYDFIHRRCHLFAINLLIANEANVTTGRRGCILFGKDERLTRIAYDHRTHHRLSRCPTFN